MAIGKAPWTEEQVADLKSYQENGGRHPFTCGNCRDKLGVQDPDGTPNERLLVPTKDGWVCPTCDYTQDWAHDFMVNGTWRKVEEQIRIGSEEFAKYVLSDFFPPPLWKRALLFALPILPVLLLRRLTVNRLFLLPAGFYSFFVWRKLKEEVRLKRGAKFVMGTDQTTSEGEAMPLELVLHWFGGFVALLLFVRAIIRPRRSSKDDEATFSQV